MIVSLSLILIDTGLRLRSQQMLTYCNSLIMRPCCGMSVNGSPHLTRLIRRLINYILVALRHTRIVGLNETQSLYYNKVSRGNLRPAYLDI